MLELMLRAVIVGALASAAAVLFEKGLQHFRLGTRHGWTFALIVTAVLPFVPRIYQGSAPDLVPALTMPAFVLEASSAATSQFNVDPVQLLWVLLSALALVIYGLALVRLHRARRHWREERIASHDVLLSNDFGPAVFGFVSPKIVVPEWVQRTTEEEQRLILLHEREHVAARDQLQLLLTLVVTALMPWNPFVWLQARRLRFTIEADCDQRVLATEPDAQRYASLLVAVGSRQNGLMLTPALAEHRNSLERRLVMLATRIIHNRWKAAGLVITGMMMTVLACEARLPNETEQASPRATGESHEVGVRKSAGVPERNELAELMQKHYPPMLRDAGVGGVVGLEMNLDASGFVTDARVVKSSGHDALDQAALRIVREMRGPFRRDAKQAAPTTAMYLQFTPNSSSKTSPPKVRALLGTPSVQDAGRRSRSSTRD